MKRKVFGIKEAILASSIVATGSAANAELQSNMTNSEVQKMEQLGLNAQEFAFLKQYTQLVSKFPELKGQFGLARLHNHFELSADEVLHETTNSTDGYSITKKTKINQLPSSALPAVLDDGDGDIYSVNVRQWCCD